MKPKPKTIQFILPQANEAELKAVYRLILEEVVGADDDRNTVAHEPCNTACHAISTNLTKRDIRTALQKLFGEGLE